MSGDFPKDVEAERRFRELWDALEARQLANPDVRTTGSVTSVVTPPTPSGLTRTQQGVGTITVTWNPVSVRNLKRYELRVADNSAMTGSKVYSTRETTWTYQEGSQDTTYYIQIRAVNSNDAESSWSKILNTETGKAFFNHLAEGAANSITVTEQTSGFSPSKLETGTADTVGTYAEVTIDLPKDADVIVLAFAKADISIDTGGTIFIRVRVDGDDIQEYENKNESGVATAGRVTVPGLGFPTFLSAGEHTFDMEVEVEGVVNDPFVTVTPVEFVVAVWEVRN